MNAATATMTYIFGVLVVIAIAVVMRQMTRGWKHRAQRQIELIGALPALPDLLGAAINEPTRGLYVGSTVAPDWLERVAAGDLGYRSKAVLTRYPEGLLLERSGTRPIWIPQESLIGIRTEVGLAGKVVPGGRRDSATAGGILVIRWRLPSGTEIDSGFRGDERRDYPRWTSAPNDEAPNDEAPKYRAPEGNALKENQ